MSTERCFLILQGPCSPLFARLADRLRADGHRILKVNFNAGDVAYWGARPSFSFRSRPDALGTFLTTHCANAGVTDQILFGDCRPLHRRATEWAGARGVRTHVFEEGYFRPHWVTLERGGVNACSRLPRDPAWFRRVGPRLPDIEHTESFRAPFRIRAWHDVMYHLAGATNPLTFPRYRTHASESAPIEYAGYMRRFAQLARIERRELARAEQLARGSSPYYLLPLQLNGDAQIREHSHFRDMCEVVEVAMESFARHAPPAARLIIKNHPLDAGLTDYARIVRDLTRRFAIPDRVEYLEAGNLDELVANARGIVTVNSTVGSVSLGAGRPTVALAKAIYALPGLTFDGPLDDFWRSGIAPDPELYRCFRRTVIHTTQINGGLYSRQGVELTVRNSVSALVAERSPLEELL